MKARLRRAQLSIRRMLVELSGWGSLPNYLIIGAQKAGTSSLHTYLIQHPQIKASLRKEVHFFDLNHSKGLAWYQSHFPLTIPGRREAVFGESSPYYMFHPLVPGRVKSILPQVKLIALLRNPIHRAFSHHQHNVRLGLETMAFEDALEREERIMPGETERLLNQPGYVSFEHRHFSYLARGRYAEQIENWLKLFSADQMLILKSERLFGEPDRVYSEVLDFLGLSPWAPSGWPVTNPGTYGSGLTCDISARLSEYFRPHNARLGELVDFELSDWEE